MVSEGTFGLQYSFALLDEQGEPAALKGGSRLISAWKKAVTAAPKNAKQLNGVRLKDNESKMKSRAGPGPELRITARGEAGTIKRDWEVKLL